MCLLNPSRVHHQSLSYADHVAAQAVPSLDFTDPNPVLAGDVTQGLAALHAVCGALVHLRELRNGARTRFKVGVRHAIQGILLHAEGHGTRWQARLKSTVDRLSQAQYCSGTADSKTPSTQHLHQALLPLA